MSDLSRRKVARPHSKLIRACEKASQAGGNLTTFAAVAKAVELTPGRISQLFGTSEDQPGTILPKDLLGKLVNAFAADGVHIKLEWFYFSFEDFAGRLEESPAPADWTTTEETINPSLVEFRLHTPVASNQADTTHIPATLIFGTIEYDAEAISLGLGEANLALESAVFTPAPQTFVGEGADPAHYTRIAGGISITGPRHGQSLFGSPFGALAVENPGTGPESLIVTITASRLKFIVTPLDNCPEAAIAPETKHAIIAALLDKALGHDPNTRPIIARATLDRKPTDAD